jgi:mannonate dehydratase
MIEAMRWFGPNDPVSLDEIRQAGATEVVTALHDVPSDTPWTKAAVMERGDLIRAAGLAWHTVESIPVDDRIKRGTADAGEYIDIWLESLRAAAAGGIEVICYNFMPVLDWTRTELDFPLSDGATALRFDATRFAAFDLFILKRPGAENDYSDQRIAGAKACFEGLGAPETEQLTASIIAGLPGTMNGTFDLEGIAEAVGLYQDISNGALLENVIRFQQAVTPEAERLGVRLAIHPDDPPRPLLGLPRAVSTRADFDRMFAATPSLANGLTWCLGSLSSGLANEALAIGREQAHRIHFAHFRVVEKDIDDPESFQEASHLGGDVSLVAAMELLLGEAARRKAAGQGARIPMRPDHGHRMAGDLGTKTNPGYGLYGRMKGLAELRGVAAGLRFRAG